MSELLEISNLKVRFGADEPCVVDDVSFKIERGETLALLGESGSGKSMIAYSIMRLLPIGACIDGGEIRLLGEELLTLPEYRMRKVRGGRIAMIFQEPQTSLNPVLTVGYQIGEALLCHQKKLSRKAIRERIVELLDSVGIPEPERRCGEYPHQFSGGMKQRIMIAIALAGEPDVLIADEPTTALDVTIQAQVLDLLKDLQRQTNMAMLFITHDLAITTQVADRMVVLERGKVLETGSCEELISGSHPATRALLEAIPGRHRRSSAKSFTSDGEKLLELRQLKIHFPIRRGILQRVRGHVKAVDGIDLSVAEGHTLAIVGESGSGKTTTGRAILQLLPATAGEVIFQGHNLVKLSAKQLLSLRRHFQIVFQDPYSSMNPKMTIHEIIQEGIVAQDRDKTVEQRERDVIQLLQQVGLDPEYRHRYPHQFSGGQRQRICIARALAVRPKLLVLDEPTSALDVSVQAQILELLLELQRELNMAYLFITHNIGIVEYLADQVAVMYQGKIVEYGGVDQVLQSPQHSYTKRLLAAVPKVRGR